MSIQMSINATDGDHLRQLLKGILQGLAQAPALEQSIVEVPVETKKPLRGNAATVKAKHDAEQAAKAAAEKASPATTVLPPKEIVPDIEAVRASLKALGSAENHGTDAVFALLEQYGAKNASTVPEDKRADLIAAINQKLEG